MKTKTEVLTGTAILSALVVVLTLLGNVIHVGPFSITLSLVPIIIGAAVYGTGTGAMLGLIFGLVVMISGIAGWDGGATMVLLSQNAFATVFGCIAKGVLAGWISALVYKALEKKQPKTAVIVSGIVCPIVNSGVFVLIMITFFMSTLEAWAGGQKILYYVLFVMTGLNFLIELAINVALASAITTIIIQVRK